MDDTLFHPSSFDDKLEQRKKLDKQLKREFVYVDAHLLSTPTIIDLDNDGNEDMIIPVSYFFDKYFCYINTNNREFYADAENIGKLDYDVKISNYVAGGIVAIDLKTRQIKWELRTSPIRC